ncbi:putative uncharacterized protein [Alistipes sp. CAG:831]|nr:putative uncharacterized protein [Alistipes sp. CAG:831]
MDEPDAGTLTGEVDFTITAGIPGGISTYAPVGSGSHNGGAMLLDPDNYDLRYIMQAYDETGKLAYNATQYVSDYFTTQQVVFEARLIAKKYNFVFWADFVPEGHTTDYYYKTTDAEDNIDLSNITYARPPVFTDDAMDAYTKVVEVNLSAQNQNITDIKLQRPFGKLRLIATDQLSGDLQDDELPATTEIKYADGTTVPDVFDALTGIASGNTRTISSITSVSMQEDAVVGGTTYTGAYFLIANYIFASDANTGYAMGVTVKDKAGKPTGTRSLSQIPIVKNKLTTVIGNFYSNSSTLEVIVEDPFEQPETQIDPEEEVLVVKPGDDVAELIENMEEPEILRVIGTLTNSDIAAIGSKFIDMKSSTSTVHVMKELDLSAVQGVTALPTKALSASDNSTYYSNTVLEKIILPEGITTIGDKAFSCLKALKEINIPESVTSIGWASFYGCSSLQSIHLPEGITEISQMCFFNCSSLSEINIPDGVEAIRNNAFYGSKVTEIHLGSGLKTLEKSAFYFCRNLSKVIFNSPELKTIGNSAFDQTAITELVLPQNLEEIGKSAFYWTNIESITLPATLKSIYANSFSTLSDVTCLSENPPTVMEGNIKASNGSYLRVPSQSVDQYKSNEQWNAFTNIIAIE